MTEISVWGTVLGAVVGASGAVIAQIISAVVTGRRESSRLAWEQERHERQLANEQAARFRDEKRELYARFLSEMYERIMPLVAVIRSEDEGTVPKFPKSAELQTDPDLNQVRWQIRLLAPSVFSHVEYTYACWVIAADYSLAKGRVDESKRRAIPKRALRHWFQTSEAMAMDLHGDTPHPLDVTGDIPEVAESVPPNSTD